MGTDRNSHILIRLLLLAAVVPGLLFIVASANGNDGAVGRPSDGHSAGIILTGTNVPFIPASAGKLVAGSAIPAVEPPGVVSDDIPGNVLRFFFDPFLQFLFPEPEPVVGLWNISATNLEMEFYKNGTAVVRYPDSGNYAPGHWERVGENRFRIWSAPGSTKTVLVFNPIADSLHSEDYTVILKRRGDVQ